MKKVFLSGVRFAVVFLLLVSLISHLYQADITVNRAFYYPYLVKDLSDDVGVLTDINLKYEPTAYTSDKSKVVEGNPNNLDGAKICPSAPVYVSLNIYPRWAYSKYISASDKKSVPVFIWNPSQGPNDAPSVPSVEPSYNNKILLNNEIPNMVRDAITGENINKFYTAPNTKGYLPNKYSSSWLSFPWVKEPARYYANLLDNSNIYNSLGYFLVVCSLDGMITSNGNKLVDLSPKSSNIKLDLSPSFGNKMLSSTVSLKDCVLILHQPDKNGNLVKKSVEQIFPTDKKIYSDSGASYSFSDITLNVNNFANIYVVNPEAKLKILNIITTDYEGKTHKSSDEIGIYNGLSENKIIISVKNTGDVPFRVTGVSIYPKPSTNSGKNAVKNVLTGLNKDIQPGETHAIVVSIEPNTLLASSSAVVKIDVNSVCSASKETFEFAYPIKPLNQLTGCKVVKVLESGYTDLNKEDDTIILGLDPSPYAEFRVLCRYDNYTYKTNGKIYNILTRCDAASDIKWKVGELKTDSTKCIYTPLGTCIPTSPYISPPLSGGESKFTWEVSDSKELLYVYPKDTVKGYVKAEVSESGKSFTCYNNFSAVKFTSPVSDNNVPNISHPEYYPTAPTYPFIPTSNNTNVPDVGTLTGCTLTPSSLNLGLLDKPNGEFTLECSYSNGTYETVGKCNKTKVAGVFLDYPSGIFSVSKEEDGSTYYGFNINAKKTNREPAVLRVLLQSVDGKRVSCSGNVNISPSLNPENLVVKSCSLSPSKITINTTENRNGYFDLSCSYMDTSKRAVYKGECLYDLTSSIKVSKDVRDDMLTASIYKGSAGYKGVKLYARINNISARIKVDVEGSHGRKVSCSGNVDVLGYTPTTTNNQPDMVSCKLKPDALNLTLNSSGREGAFDLYCGYNLSTVRNSRKIVYDFCPSSLIYKIEASSNSSVARSKVEEVNGIYPYISVDGHDIGYTSVITTIWTNGGKRFSCSGDVYVNSPSSTGGSNISSSTNTSSALSGGGRGGREETGIKYTCRVNAPEVAYVGNKYLAEVKCYESGKEIDCSSRIPHSLRDTAVNWTTPYNRVVSTSDQNLSIYYDKDLANTFVNVSATWNIPSPFGPVDCSPATVNVRIPSCIRFL